MELKQLSEHIWIMPFETERDRPNLGYVKGNNWSLAIDAGHSASHTGDFYALLEKEQLPLPAFEQDKTLFLGDSACDDFLTGVKRADLCRKLADTIKGFGPEICLEGHWTPVDTEDTLTDLMNGI